MPVHLRIPYLENRPGFERLELLNLAPGQLRFAVVGRPKFVRETVLAMPGRIDAHLDGDSVHILRAVAVPGPSQERAEFAALFAFDLAGGRAGS